MIIMEEKLFCCFHNEDIFEKKIGCPPLSPFSLKGSKNTDYQIFFCDKFCGSFFQITSSALNSELKKRGNNSFE